MYITAKINQFLKIPYNSDTLEIWSSYLNKYDFESPNDFLLTLRHILYPKPNLLSSEFWIDSDRMFLIEKVIRDTYFHHFHFFNVIFNGEMELLKTLFETLNLKNVIGEPLSDNRLNNFDEINEKIAYLHTINSFDNVTYTQYFAEKVFKQKSPKYLIFLNDLYFKDWELFKEKMYKLEKQHRFSFDHINPSKVLDVVFKEVEDMVKLKETSETLFID